MFRLGEVHFYIIMVGLVNVLIRNIHTDTRVSLLDDDRSNGKHILIQREKWVFGFVKYVESEFNTFEFVICKFNFVHTNIK